MAQTKKTPQNLPPDVVERLKEGGTTSYWVRITGICNGFSPSFHTAFATDIHNPDNYWWLEIDAAAQATVLRAMEPSNIAWVMFNADGSLNRLIVYSD